MQNEILLLREPSTEQGTFGKLILPDGHEYFSLELPWKENTPIVSCIPVGSYLIQWLYSPHFHEYLYHVTGVKDRWDIEIHQGNFAGDVACGWQSNVKGCILVGMTRGKIENEFGNLQNAICASSIALEDFNDRLGESNYTLIISEED